MFVDILQFIQTVRNRIKKQNEFVLNCSISLHNNTRISHIDIFVIFVIIVLFFKKISDGSLCVVFVSHEFVFFRTPSYSVFNHNHDGCKMKYNTYLCLLSHGKV